MREEAIQSEQGPFLPEDPKDAKRKAIKHFQNSHETLDRLKDWQEKANVSLFGKYLAKKHEMNLIR